MQPRPVSTRPTTTFAWNFRSAQRGLVTSRSGSPSGPTSRARSTSAATSARIAPRRNDRTGMPSSFTRHLVEERFEVVQMPLPWVAFGHLSCRRAARGPSVGHGAADCIAERRAVRRVGDHELGEPAVEELGRTDRGARHGGHARGRRLEHDVAERLLVRRETELVGGSEDALDIGPRTEHVHVPAERWRCGDAAIVREPLIVAHQEEHRVAGWPGAPAFEQQVEALPREARTDRDADRPTLEPELAPHAHAVGVAAPRVEAFEVDPVVDDAYAIAWDGVVADDLVGHAARHGEHPA